MIFYKVKLGLYSFVGFRAAALSTFKKLWRQLCPQIVCCRPMTDLCWECQKNNNLINMTVNCDEENKTATLQRQQAHLLHVKEERAMYKKQVADAKLVVANGNMKLGRTTLVLNMVLCIILLILLNRFTILQIPSSPGQCIS